MPTAIETKDLSLIDLEIRAEDVDDTGIIKGHAAAFNNTDSYNDIIHPGAFARACKNFSDVKVLWQHDSWEPIGKPYLLREDKKGLWTESQLVLDVETGRKAYTLMKAGVINRFSIGFSADPKKQKFETVKGKRVRHLLDIDLWEFSPITFPANNRAKITSVKSATNARELEQVFKAHGFSNSVAKYLAANHKFGAGLCESDGAAGQPGAGLREADGDGPEHGNGSLDELAEFLKQKRSTIFDFGDLPHARRNHG